MWFWLVVATLIIVGLILAIFLESEYKGLSLIPLAIGALFILSLGVSFNNNYKMMNRGIDLAQSVLDSKFYDATLEGNLIKVSASRFDITNLEGLKTVESFLKQADYVDYNTYANQHGWLNIFHPDPEKPLLKIEIVKTP